jgi:cell division septal protein FtsQ
MPPRPTARKKVNRRTRASTSRDHLLDVRIRTSTARRRNQEIAGRWIRNLLFLTFLISGSVFGVRYALDRFFFQNAEYTLRRITLELDGLFTREQALEEAELREGVNIFSVDLAKVEKTFRAIPQVQSAQVVRELPDHIRVTLTARKPVAWVAAEGETGDPTTSDRSFLTDANGFLMRPRRVTPEDFHLPVIYGLKSDNLREGEELRNDDMRNVLKLLETVAQHPESLLKIRTMDVSKGYRIDVVNDTNSLIIFAASDFEEQLARLQKLLLHCNETGRTLESVNLMVRRNTPVRFVMASAPPVEEPAAPPARVPSKPSKTRRN